MQRDDVTLLDMLHATQAIVEFIEGLDKEQFLADSKTQSAVLYQLLVLGEAVKRLSREVRSQHSHVPWSLIAGMRDQLIHAYDVIDWDEVWKTATEDVPTLMRDLEAILSKRLGKT